MKKKSNFIVAFVLLAVLSTPLSAAFQPVLPATGRAIALTSSSTNVSGRISTNTTWTLANSPYIVVDDVIVETGIFLRISPSLYARIYVQVHEAIACANPRFRQRPLHTVN